MRENVETTKLRIPPFLYFVGAFLVGVAVELLFPVNWPTA